ncbi:MAG TPA: 5-oxoprolinase subunit PxpA [Streptosporangiaceae bacterium]|nr:5-oxoprolinase subunit PxpA [Streptosporangiaceae bacterium]
MAEPVTDLNADLGESFGAWKLGDDQALMQVITSANVACGFHAGDPLTLRQTCAMAAAAGVTIGAQVSYRDLAGFGRRDMAVPADELAAELLYQIAALDGIAKVEGSRVSYVKPHGALYHRVRKDTAQATALVEAIRAYDPALPLLTQAPGEAAELAATAGLRVVAEAFADRGYTADGSLVPRGQPGALRTDPAEVAERAVTMVTTGVVTSDDGIPVPVQARSLCVHGDTPGAVALATAVRQALERAGIRLAPFA